MVGAGGISATIGRYVRYRRYDTRLLVADPEGSAFFDAWRTGDPSVTASGSRIEGIGRPRVELAPYRATLDRFHRDGEWIEPAVPRSS